MHKNFFNGFQSGFRPHRTTELGEVLKDIHLNSDTTKITVSVLLDLSVVQHTRKVGGLSGAVLNWFKSYLQDRYYFVSIGNYESEQINHVEFLKGLFSGLCYSTSTCSPCSEYGIL